MWIAVALVVGLASMGILVGAVLIGRAQAESGTLGAAMSGDQWAMLGVVFTGAGAALMATTGPSMVWLVVLGIIYLGMGVRMKRGQHK